MSVSHVADCPDLGPECFDAGPPPTPYNHHVDQVVAETILDASLGLLPWLGVDLRWSLRVVDVSPTYTELDGSPKSVPDDIHHHDETRVDFTDPWILSRFAARQGRFVSVARFGLSLPVGRTEEDPYRLGRRGESHEHLQAGTGTVVPIVGWGGTVALEPVSLGLSAIGFFSAYEGDNGFRAPVRLYGNQRTAVSFIDGALTPFAELTLAHEGEEYWHGRSGLEGSNVRSEIYVGGGVDWRFLPSWTAGATARVRVASLTDAPTFETNGLFSLSLSTTFELWKSGGDDAGPAIKETHRDGVTELEKQ